jgi:hypothetical protein
MTRGRGGGGVVCTHPILRVCMSRIVLLHLYIYIYIHTTHTFVEHRSTLITNSNGPTSLILTASNRTNRSDLTPPDAGPLYNQPPTHTTPTLGFPPPHCHPILCPMLGYPRPRCGDRKVSMVAAHQSRRRRHDGLWGWGGASSVAIKFSGTAYLEAGWGAIHCNDWQRAQRTQWWQALAAARWARWWHPFVAAAWQTRWQNPLATAVAQHYDLIGQSEAHPPWCRPYHHDILAMI